MDKLMEYFVKNPEKEFYVRELAKLVKKAPTTVSTYLKKYKKDGILESEHKFNHLLFKANTNSSKFKQLKLNYNINLLYASGLIEYIINEFNHPEAIVLFGSFSKAQNIANSDIDLLVITPLKKDLNLKKYEKILGHEIQLFVHSDKEIKKMREKNKGLVNKWINGIILDGFWEMLK
jgi:predicted nucleotidyltransferase